MRSIRWSRCLISVLRALHQGNADELEHPLGQAPLCSWYRLPAVQGIHPRRLQVSFDPLYGGENQALAILLVV